MQKLIVMDTETSGLPVWGEPSEGANQPHLVQLAALVVDLESREIEQEMDLIIKPDGWEWDEDNEAFKTHGITVERAMDEGVPEQEAVEQYLAMRADLCRCGHNISFDDRILRIALKRYFSDELAEEYKAGEKRCTGLLAKPIMQMPAPPQARRFGKYKMPKLSEAYEFFTGQPLEDAHNAMTDCRACLDVYWGILDHQTREAAAAAS